MHVKIKFIFPIVFDIHIFGIPITDYLLKKGFKSAVSIHYKQIILVYRDMSCLQRNYYYLYCSLIEQVNTYNENKVL